MISKIQSYDHYPIRKLQHGGAEYDDVTKDSRRVAAYQVNR
jgi:hypothetical protein